MAQRKRKTQKKTKPKGRPKGSKTKIPGRLTGEKAVARITGQPEQEPTDCLVVELRIREGKSDGPVVISSHPPPAVQLALSFEAWARTLPRDQRALLQTGVVVKLPPAVDETNEEFIVVRPSQSSQAAINPWDAWKRRRGQVSRYTTHDFMCEFSALFRDTTKHKYTFRGGFVGEDYKKVYTLREIHGNDVLFSAMCLLMEEWKAIRARNRKSRLPGLKTAPTIPVLFAFFNDLVALLSEDSDSGSETQGEQAEAKSKRKRRSSVL